MHPSRQAYVEAVPEDTGIDLADVRKLTLDICAC